MLGFTVVDNLEQIPDDTPTEADTDNTILVTQATIQDRYQQDFYQNQKYFYYFFPIDLIWFLFLTNVRTAEEKHH